MALLPLHARRNEYQTHQIEVGDRPCSAKSCGAARAAAVRRHMSVRVAPCGRSGMVLRAAAAAVILLVCAINTRWIYCCDQILEQRHRTQATPTSCNASTEEISRMNAALVRASHHKITALARWHHNKKGQKSANCMNGWTTVTSSERR